MSDRVKFTLLPECPPSVQEMFWACELRLRQREASIVAGMFAQSPPCIQIMCNGLKPARQTHRRLAGRKSPKGEIIADCGDDSECHIVSFSVVEVLAWIVANKWAKAEEPQ